MDLHYSEVRQEEVLTEETEKVYRAGRMEKNKVRMVSRKLKNYLEEEITQLS